MSTQDNQFRAATADLAKALHAAAPLATRLRRELSAQAEDAVTLEATIGRAVRAVTRVRETTDD